MTKYAVAHWVPVSIHGADAMVLCLVLFMPLWFSVSWLCLCSDSGFCVDRIYSMGAVAFCCQLEGLCWGETTSDLLSRDKA
jgi:hypothetical protein